ncbi:MAG: hypothetical protein GY906_21185 [bacterium]|nr:hypothetical protein [bacterium]
MTWKVDYCKRAETIHISASGTMDLRTITAMGSEALATASPRRPRRFLLNARDMAPDVTTAAIYQLPGILTSHGLKHGDRVAIVYRPNTEHGRNFEFFETVSVNRGYSVRVFLNVEDAWKWLGVNVMANSSGAV